MYAAIFGSVCALIQLFILSCITKSITCAKSNLTGLFVIIKMAVWVLFFSLMVLFFRDDMLYCGIAMGATLVLGGVLLFIIYTMKPLKKIKKEKKEKKEL